MPIISGISDQVVITFLFTLAIVFGVLQFASPIKSRPVNLLIALALAAFASGYGPLVSSLWQFLPTITWFFIVIFLFAFTLKITGIKQGQGGDFEGMVANAAVLLVLFGVGFSLLQQFTVEIPLIGGGQNLLFLLGFIFVLAIFYGAMKIGIGKEGGQQQQ